jgi:hypothetical protein
MGSLGTSMGSLGTSMGSLGASMGSLGTSMGSLGASMGSLGASGTFVGRFLRTGATTFATTFAGSGGTDTAEMAGSDGSAGTHVFGRVIFRIVDILLFCWSIPFTFLGRQIYSLLKFVLTSSF